MKESASTLKEMLETGWFDYLNIINNVKLAEDSV
jgi:hypothetical protein